MYTPLESDNSLVPSIEPLTRLTGIHLTVESAVLFIATWLTRAARSKKAVQLLGTIATMCPRRCYV
jgi:hypothetical protein